MTASVPPSRIISAAIGISRLSPNTPVLARSTPGTFVARPVVLLDVAATGMIAAVFVVAAFTPPVPAAPPAVVPPAPPAVVPPVPPAVVPVGGVDVGDPDVGDDDVEDGVVTGVVHAGVVKVFVSKVTAPLRASARPTTVLPVSTVIEVNAMIVPAKVDPGFKVAELPTCQNTLQACVPLVMTTLPPVSVVSAEPT
jgi:hypothetical protein